MYLLIHPALIETLATVLMVGLLLYVLLGIVFSVFFLRKGAAQIDSGVQGAPRSFWLLIIPGTVAFWPLLWRKWRKATKTKQSS